MPHPLVDQFRFTRSEWLRGLEGVSEEEGAVNTLTTEILLTDLLLNGVEIEAPYRTE